MATKSAETDTVHKLANKAAPKESVNYDIVAFIDPDTNVIVNKDEKHKVGASVTNKDSQKPPADIEALKRDYLHDGLIITVFDVPIADLIQAIKKKTVIQNVLLADRIQDPNFRFLTKLDVNNSLVLSAGISAAIEVAKSIAWETPFTKSIEKRQANADRFAIVSYGKIKKLKEKAGITSLRETVNLLNEKGIHSYKGGKWHMKTLQDLYKRCEDLGLIPQTPKKLGSKPKI